MSLPLGHLALGVAVYDLSSPGESVFRNWRPALMVGVLANLPDIDMIFGLFLRGDGGAFHRGPTHSILFAFLAALVAVSSRRLWPRLPRFGFALSFGLVLSHLLADLLLTNAPVSLLWPLQVHFGHYSGGWHQVLHTAVQVQNDLGLIIACATVLLCRRLLAPDYLCLEGLWRRLAVGGPKG